MIKVVTHTFYFSLPKELEAAKDFEERFGNKYEKNDAHPDLIVFTKTESVFYSGFKGGKLPAN